MQIQEERTARTLLLRVRGRLDSNTSPQFLNLVQARIEDGISQLVVDLSEVVYVSSAGLRAFFALHKKLSAHGLTLVGIRSVVFEVFAIAGFDQILNFGQDADSLTELP